MKKLSILFLLLSTLLFANGVKPVMLYDTKEIFDKSWNEAIHKGIKKFEKRVNIKVEEASVLNIKEFRDKINYYTKNGYNPIMFNNLYQEKEEVIKKMILEYPKTRFIVFNGRFNIPNVHYFIFSNQESSFLAGYLASKQSKTKKLGFVGGMDIPLIRNFLCGYIKGAKYQNKNTKILYDFVGDDFSNAWNNKKAAFDLSSKQIKDGADIIFSPTGGSSLGALKAAHEKKVLGIGVDSNQNNIYPGSVLTSTMVRVDNAAFRSLMAAKRDIWGEQMKVMGLQENGVQLAFDKHNETLISKELRNELEHIKADIILKKIPLDDYTFTNTCKIENKVLF